MKRNYHLRRIDDSDFYLGIALICRAIDGPYWTTTFIAFLCWLICLTECFTINPFKTQKNKDKQ